MSEVTIGKCSVCGGEVTVISPPYFGTPIPKCKKCGAVEDRVKNLPTIPMKPVKDFRGYQHQAQQDYFGIKKKVSEEINLKAIHQLQEYCQQANTRIGELNKQLKQARAEVIEQIQEWFKPYNCLGQGSDLKWQVELVELLTKLSEVKK